MDLIQGEERVRIENPEQYERVKKLNRKYFRALQTAKKDATKRDALYTAQAAIKNALGEGA